MSLWECFNHVLAIRFLFLPGMGLSDPGQRAASLPKGNTHHAGRKGSLQMSAIKVQSEHYWWRHVQLQQHYVLSL